MPATFRPPSAIAALAFAALVPTAALAQTTPPPAPAPAAAPAPEPTPEHTFTANVGLFSEYIFRGMAQTSGKIAVQGGVDYSHSSGLYLGTWASNIKWLKDFGAYSSGGSVEWDFYGGYKTNFPGSEDWGYDVGTLYYYYPGTVAPGAINANTWEVYGAVNYKWLGAKVSYSLNDYFGARPLGKKMDGTIYVDLYANYPVGESGVTLVGHYGILDARHDGSGNNKVSYNDWKLGLSYTVPEGALKGVEVGAYYTGNDSKSKFYTDLKNYDTAKDRGVVYVKVTF